MAHLPLSDKQLDDILDAIWYIVLMLPTMCMLIYAALIAWDHW